MYFDSPWLSITPSRHVLPTEHGPLKWKEIIWRPTNPFLHGMTFFGTSSGLSQIVFIPEITCEEIDPPLDCFVFATSGSSVGLEPHVLVKEQVSQPWLAPELNCANTHCKCRYQVATSLTRFVYWLPKKMIHFKKTWGTTSSLYGWLSADVGTAMPESDRTRRTWPAMINARSTPRSTP